MHTCGGETLHKNEYPPIEKWRDWYERQKNSEYSWIIEFENRCIGSAGFHNISYEDKNATYRIGIFDTNLHSKGVGTAVTKLLLNYAFKMYKWHRIQLKVLDYNHRAIKCYEKCGFKIDGILRESALIEGKYHSDIIMSIINPE